MDGTYGPAINRLADAYDVLYEGAGGIANYFYFYDSAGARSFQQHIVGTNHFRKLSQSSFRFAGGERFPGDRRRVLQVKRTSFTRTIRSTISRPLSVNGFAVPCG